MFRNATVLTMDDAGIIEDGDVLVTGDTIAAVGPHLDVPADAVEIDASGRHRSCPAWSTRIGTCGRRRCAGWARTGR